MTFTAPVNASQILSAWINSRDCIWSAWTFALYLDSITALSLRSSHRRSLSDTMKMTVARRAKREFFIRLSVILSLRYFSIDARRLVIYAFASICLGTPSKEASTSNIDMMGLRSETRSVDILDSTEVIESILTAGSAAI